MSERKPPPSLDDLGARLEQARARNEPRRRNNGGQGGYGAAFQVAIEMVGSLVVSVGLGWVLDDWLDTGPLFLVICFFLGAAAGGLNVYRRALQLAAPADDENDADDAPE
ncbi:MAG: AtpZ/AtpI family protein [Alphaproteobacteria bacterium]